MKVLLLALALFSAVTFAEDNANFEEHKKEILSKIDKRIAMMNEHKSCVSSASSKDALKKCRESIKEEKNEMQKENKEERAQKIDERIKKLQEMKTKSK
jgi:hypothetical protein